MRAHPIVLVILSIALAACNDESGPGLDGTFPTGRPSGSPSGETPGGGTPPDGIVLISTSTVGSSPDLDGYRISVDGTARGEALGPTGTIAIGLLPGLHALRLLGVLPQCREASDSVVQVNVVSRDTVPVAFDIRCWVTGVLTTVSTSGLDLDTNGYTLLVDGAEQMHLHPFDRSLTALEPGAHTIALADLEPNCTANPSSDNVAVADSQVTPIAFAVGCTAASGVIGILIHVSCGATREFKPICEESFEPRLDGAPVSFDSGEVLALSPEEQWYLSDISAGRHVVSLARSSPCTDDTGPQRVTVTVGGATRDTADVTFSVTCPPPPADEFATLRNSTTTTGSFPPSTGYIVRASLLNFWDYVGSTQWAPLASLGPNETQFVQVVGNNDWWYFELDGVPSNCSAQSPTPPDARGFTPIDGDTLDLAFTVTCPG